MVVFLAWVGFAATVALALVPVDAAADMQLVVRILLAAMAGLAAPEFVREKMIGVGRTRTVIQIVAGTAAAAALLFFNLYPAWAQASIAALIGMGAIWATQNWIERFDFPGTRSARFVLLIQVLLILSWFAFVAGIAYALFIGEETSFTQAASLVLLGTLAICFAAYTAKALAEGRPFQLESHWGGLGGGMGGWRVSQPIILVILTVVFSGSTVTLLIHGGHASGGDEASPSATANEGTPESGAESAVEDADDPSAAEQAADDSGSVAERG